VQSKALKDDLTWLRRERQFEVIATVVGQESEALRGFKRGERIAVLFGNEAQGLHAEHRRTV
jgi:tRNA G18 (ribose-2'-O)-methylase SpoU